MPTIGLRDPTTIKMLMSNLIAFITSNRMFSRRYWIHWHNIVTHSYWESKRINWKNTLFELLLDFVLLIVNTIRAYVVITYNDNLWIELRTFGFLYFVICTHKETPENTLLFDIIRSTGSRNELIYVWKGEKYLSSSQQTNNQEHQPLILYKLRLNEDRQMNRHVLLFNVFFSHSCSSEIFTSISMAHCDIDRWSCWKGSTYGIKTLLRN